MIAILLRTAGCLVGLLILAAPVRAAIITTVEFAGTLTSTNMPSTAMGDDFEGSFRFENSLLISAGLAFAPSASPPGPSLGPIGLGPGDTFLVVVTPGTGGDPDSVEIKLTLDPGLTWPDGVDVTVTSWSILFDSSGLASSLFEMRGVGCDGTSNEGCTADGFLTEVSASQSPSVPEPASLPLLIAALGIGLWFSGRRRPRRI